MSENRIQKLLFNEYSDFEDIILIESPFAQTTKDGEGVRQIQMGLTPTKLILAYDNIESEIEFDPTAQIDPDIGSLELSSLFPVECVNISVYRRKNRKTLKAHFCNNQVIYFELASSFKREMFWNDWCERIKFLNPEDDGPFSINSETSVGSTSVSTSTAYGQKHLKSITCQPWDTKDVYLGEHFGLGESAIERKLKGQPHIPREKDIGDKRLKNGRADSVCMVNRFGQGISENCCTHLYLPVQIYVSPKFDQKSHCSTDFEEQTKNQQLNGCDPLLESDILWQERRPVKHRRRYGISPLGYLFCGLGTISIYKPQGISLQLKRCCSEVNILKKDEELEDLIGFPRRLLTSSLSCHCLINCSKSNSSDKDHTPVRGSSKYNFYHGACFFWTTNFWFRPMKPKYGYKKLMEHLKTLQNFYKIQEMNGRKLLLWTAALKERRKEENCNETQVKQNTFLISLINSAKLELAITSWDFSSTAIAYQLTAIDRDLFIQIPVHELAVLLYERNTNNAPHIKAMIAFCERIINVITTEIIRIDSVKLRAKLIAKYINVARKNEYLQNMHTTKTVLLSLQSPAIYRLKETWSYVRTHHNNKYRRLYVMLQTHKELRSKSYAALFNSIAETRPYLPALAHIISALFGRLPPALFRILSTSTLNEQKECKRSNNIPLWPKMSEDSNISEATITRSVSSSGTSLNDEAIFKRIKIPKDHNALTSLTGTNSHLGKMIVCFEEWQRIASQFGFIENPVLNEFLLKSKYMDQEECFIMSLKMEPPDQPNKKHSTPNMFKFKN